jgi:indolepyruvate ferredoxin oxidoreductase alpha subunit
MKKTNHYRGLHMTEHVLLGDEALALGAIHAGISLAYGYPGTPSTEIIEYLQRVQPGRNYRAHWCSNEKTAYEAAVGASMMNRRSLVTMKHVGLNVAADPFMNSVLMNIKGGLVLAVADDPGMHSSQNEQDSRYFADFAKMPCLEPRNQQEAYEMTMEAFDLSERFSVPVMVKLVTRLSHSRAVVRARDDGEGRGPNPPEKFPGVTDYMVLPAISRRNYAHHLEVMKDLEAWSEASEHNRLELNPRRDDLAVITTGLGGNYYEENIDELDSPPSRLHISAYPLPTGKIRELAASAKRVVCIEEGYPYVERLLKGLLPGSVEIGGKLDGSVPASGELNPDNVRPAMGLAPVAVPGIDPGPLPGRPPQLCPACPHADTFISMKEALESYPESLVTSDIGCYTLGFLPPHQAIETALCMGASIPMARGAAESGMHPAIATIGDSTFMHSGLTGLADAAAADVPMTVIIMDNETTAMTGGQDTVVTSARIRAAVEGLGVDPEHIVELVPLPKRREDNTAAMRREFEHKGLSVVIAIRECVQTMKKRNLAKKAAQAANAGA